MTSAECCPPQIKSKSDAALFAPLLKGADPAAELSVDDVIQKLADAYGASSEVSVRQGLVPPSNHSSCLG
jgi:hypothetical protein